MTIVIDPFVAGVVATVVVEFAAMWVWGVMTAIRKRKQLP